MEWIWLACLLLLAAPVAVIGYFFFAQTRMVFPGSCTQGLVDAACTPPPDADLINFNAVSGEQIAALFGGALQVSGAPHPNAFRASTILWFYGNGDCLARQRDMLQYFRYMGLNVLIPEYIGYGLSEGRPSEAACYATAEAAYKYLITRPDIDPEKIFFAGSSLGGSVAIELATKKRCLGVAIFSTFTTLLEVGEKLYPYLPVRALLRPKFDNMAKIPQLRGPILIGHGKMDRLTPFAMADALAKAATAPITRVTIEDAGHNDLFAVGGRPFHQALQRFFDALTEDATIAQQRAIEEADIPLPPVGY